MSTTPRPSTPEFCFQMAMLVPLGSLQARDEGNSPALWELIVPNIWHSDTERLHSEAHSGIMALNFLTIHKIGTIQMA